MVKKKDVRHEAQPPLSLCLQSNQRLAGDKALSDHAQRSRPLISREFQSKHSPALVQS